MKKLIILCTLSCFSATYVISQTNEDAARSHVKEVIVIFKTHYDIGYTKRVDEVVNFYRTDMIDKIFNVMDDMGDRSLAERLVWTMPGWVTTKMLENYPEQSAERLKKIEQAFRSGKIVTDALPFTMASEVCEPEELVRGLGLASKLTRHYQRPLPRSGKQTDEPSHPGALVTILAHSGINFLHIGCNDQWVNVQTPELFWWEGPDQSKILTFYSPNYGNNISRFYGNRWKGPEKMVGKNFLPPADWPYQVWPAILVTTDNWGAPPAEQIKELLDEVQQQMPGVKVRMGTMDDFYEAFMKENPVLPVVRAEMPDSWIHGVMSDPGGMRLSREAHPLIATTEVLNTQLQCWGIPAPSIAQPIAAAYENILLYGEHTWGRSTKVFKYGQPFKEIPDGEYADLEASWEDKTNYIRKASQMVREMNQSNMELLAKSIKQKSPYMLVYNPLPWKRSGIVEINNRKIYVEDIPPYGYRTFPIQKENKPTSKEAANSIENDFYRIVFDAGRGIITSLYDKRTGREWVDNRASHHLGQYLNERFTLEQTWDCAALSVKEYVQKENINQGFYKPGMVSEKDVPYRAASPENGTLTILDDGYMQKAELVMPGQPSNHLPSTILRVILYKNEPYIDMEITVIDKEKDNWPEADWLCLPFRIDNPQFHVHRSLGIMNPTDILSGANRHLYAVGNGVVITGSDGTGVAVCPVDHSLISLDTPGIWKFSYDFVPQRPVVYVNLYNNQWNTNFRYWYAGTWSSRVRIWTLGKDIEKDAFFTTQALETRNPLQAIASENSTGTLPAKQDGIEIDRKGVIVTTFGVDPDENPGTLLRVWEQAGMSGKLTITLPKGMKASKAIPVNLRGEKKGSPLLVKSGKFSFDLNAYAPASFLLE